MSRFCFLFLLLTLYSFLGWCGEMVYCSAGQRRLCEKRGFLNGPVCPIYGHGALIVLRLLDGGCENPVFTFLLGAVLTSVVEYVTSFLMEKLFHMRWWDYSRRRFQINGRVCLRNSVLFGLACVFLRHFAHPVAAAWADALIGSGAGVPLALVLLAVYLADIFLSVRSAVQIGARLARLHAVYDELSEKLAALGAELQQSAASERRRLEDAFSSRLESAKAEAQQKFRALCERQDVFERRLLRSFPAMRSIRHPDALKRLREYLESRIK